MGLFGGFKKKDAEAEKAQTFQSSPAMSQDEILSEVFYGIDPVEGARNNEICDRFVAKGIVDHANHTFDANTLDELSFDEFCHIYSTIGWFVENRAPHLRESAADYKRLLRKKLLARLATMPVYIIYAKVTGLPLVMPDDHFLLYTDRDCARRILETGYDWMEVHELTPESFEAAFREYFCTGYKRVVINGKSSKVNLVDIYQPQPLAEYGNLCVESCIRMIDYKQTEATIMSKAQKEGRRLTEEEMTRLNQRSWAVSISLLEDRLVLPCVEENGEVKISVPTADFSSGRRFITLFTDYSALSRCFKGLTHTATLPNLIRDQYRACKDDPSISGILINPGREEYMLTKEMLLQLPLT